MSPLTQIFAREIPFVGFDIKDIKDQVEAGKRPEFPVSVTLRQCSACIEILKTENT